MKMFTKVTCGSQRKRHSQIFMCVCIYTQFTQMRIHTLYFSLIVSIYQHFKNEYFYFILINILLL